MRWYVLLCFESEMRMNFATSVSCDALLIANMFRVTDLDCNTLFPLEFHGIHLGTHTVFTPNLIRKTDVNSEDARFYD